MSDHPLTMECECDTAVLLNEGASKPCLRVKYRAAGERRWTRFLLVLDDAPAADDGLTDALIGQAWLATEAHYRQRAEGSGERE